MKMSALISADPPGLAVGSQLLAHLDCLVELARRAPRAARTAPSDESLVDPGAELDRGAVRPDDHVRRRCEMPRMLASCARELDLGVGPLELELLDALDRPGPRRASGSGRGAAGRLSRRGCSVGWRRRGGGALRPRRQLGVLLGRRRARACGSISTPKRSASFAIQATSSGAGGITARRRRCGRPSRLTIVPSRSR